jgi:1-deoxy-D-xylulose-5-phosphate reductoisomerase
MKKIAVLGVTGSIGIQTLDVIKQHTTEFELIAVSAGRNIEKTIEIVNEFKPQFASVMNEDDAKHVEEVTGVKCYFGMNGLIKVATATDADTLVTAVVGSVGLKPTIEAIKAGKNIALANKETLVTAGHIVMNLAKEYGVTILPVDSEHSAIFQCLDKEEKKDLNRLIITASGGSFRDKTRDELEGVSVEDALNHPNWSMGAKITIDSASMMNKGLEVIEAHWLFDVDYDDIDVILHKESVIHSMIEMNDKSVLAHLGTPDMRIPIQYALTYPHRFELESETLDLARLSSLNFKEMDFDRFPCLRMAYDAGRVGGSMPTVLNAANESAVALFLDGKIDFLDIETLIQEAMDEHVVISNPSLDEILALDIKIKESIKKKVVG